MISFRYHLVSLICVFLGIALGVVIGTAALNGAVVGDLRRQNTDLKNSLSSSGDQNKQLQTQASAANQLAQSFGGRISAKALTGKTVLLIGAPGATKAMKDGITAQVTAAGGQIVGSLQLSKQFDDPAHANDIQSLATTVHPLGLTLPQTDNAGILAGSLLGYTLMGHAGASDIQAVISGFSSLGMVSADSPVKGGAQSAVIVAPGALPDKDEGGAMLLAFATQYGSTGGPTLVAGDTASANQHGLVDLARADSSAQKALSTVDNADTPLGQLSVALALAGELSGHRGSFGGASGADAMLPGVSN